jgi:hypothetical protein
MERWDLESWERERLLAILAPDLSAWGVASAEPVRIVLGERESYVEGYELLGGPDTSRPTIHDSVRKIDELLHGDQARVGRDLADLVPVIEEMIKRFWELKRELRGLEAQRKAPVPIHVAPSLAAPEMHTEPGKHLMIFLQRLASENDRTKRAQLVTGAISAVHAMDQSTHVAQERMDQIKLVADFLMAQGIETVCLDGAPEVLLEMLTEPSESTEGTE